MRLQNNLPAPQQVTDATQTQWRTLLSNKVPNHSEIPAQDKHRQLL